MSGLFGFFNYDKPGPGVPKDAPPKPRIIEFFGIYSRNFWNLVKLNIVFFIFNAPALISTYILFLLFYGSFQTLFSETGMFYSFVVFFAFGALLICIPSITTGPVQAGFTYVLKTYSIQEHAFTMSDFKEHSFKNFKQGIIISIIDFIVLLFVFVDIYIVTNTKTNSLLVSLSMYFVILLSYIFLLMHMYIYPMLVTFNLSLKDIYKNAFIFAVVKFFPNTGILLLCFALCGIPFLIFPVLAVVLFPLITVSTIGLITNFYVYPILKKYMINPQ